MCLAAGKGGVRIPDTDGSDSLSSGPLCVLQRLAPSWHQTCLFSAWLGDLSPPRLAPSGASIKSYTGSLPNESLLGMWGKQGSIGAATPLSGASGLAGQRETSKVRSLASWLSGAEQEPGGVKWGHGPS